MNKMKILACLLALIQAGIASAEGPSDNRVPAYIEVTADGAIIIEAATTNWNNPDGCTHPKRIFIPANNVFIDRYYAAALAAHSGNRTVWAWLAGCEVMPWGEEYPIVKNLAIR